MLFSVGGFWCNLKFSSFDPMDTRSDRLAAGGVASLPIPEFELAVKSAALASGLRPERDLILVALSGGADSVALLLALYHRGYRVEAAHCNFCLRQEHSDRDEAFVMDLCHKLGIVCHCQRFDTNDYARARGLSIEMAARELRYDYFRSLMESSMAEALALAHHREDNVETLLLNLCAGTGLRGLTAMRVWSAETKLFRPLLSCSRVTIEEYLTFRNQDFCTDHTNTDTIYRRNFVRHRLLPMMRELNPSVDHAIERTILNLQGVEDLFVSHLSAMVERFYREKRFPISEIERSASPETLLYELLRPAHFSRKMILDIVRHLDRTSGAVYDSPTHRLLRTTREIRIYELSALIESEEEVLDLSRAETTWGQFALPANHAILCWERMDVSLLDSLVVGRSEALFDWDKLGRLTLRPRKKGDRIYPFGMKGAKKVSRILIDSKCPLVERNSPILCSDDEPIWLMGIAADRRFAIDSRTKLCLRLKFISEDSRI